MTTPAKPTPGPWRVDPNRPTRVLSIDKIPVAAVSGWAPALEGWANARLIAAAPEMRDLLERLYKVAEYANFVPTVGIFAEIATILNRIKKG